MYNTHCDICGRPITVRAKTNKYCPSCRGVYKLPETEAWFMEKSGRIFEE